MVIRVFLERNRFIPDDAYAFVGDPPLERPFADEVLVINVGGYVGESTRREIAYAYSQGKPVR